MYLCNRKRKTSPLCIMKIWIKNRTHTNGIVVTASFMMMKAFGTVVASILTTLHVMKTSSNSKIKKNGRELL